MKTIIFGLAQKQKKKSRNVFIVEKKEKRKKNVKKSRKKKNRGTVIQSKRVFFINMSIFLYFQVDYIHCLVPDLKQITNCSFYWGKMDRYEAERLLENKPEGTFLLRDSAQEEFLFSVSFRKYDRSLHARIEQFNHKFR